MNLRDYWNLRSVKDEFSVFGILDKVLTDKGIRYLLFFESDEKFNEEISYYEIGFPFAVFFTRNGFHVVAHKLHSALDKKQWFETWANCYPHSDFFIENATLRPHTFEELSFIVNQAFTEKLLTEPIRVKYYRDKRVLENLGF